MAAFVSGGCGVGGQRRAWPAKGAAVARTHACPTTMVVLPVARAGLAATAKKNQYMGTSVAPEIVLTDKGSDMSRKVKTEDKKVAADQAAAMGILANMSLYASLNPVKRMTYKAKEQAPAYVKKTGNPVEDFYPSSWRNMAPVISLSANRVAVAFEKIDAASNGVKANSNNKPFWKSGATTKNYVAPEAPAQSEPETLDDAAYQRYFPARIRNKAPAMEFRRPSFANTEDPSAYFMLQKETVPLRMALAEKLLTKLGRKGDG
nr:Chain KA, CaRSPs1 [Porphyridium purpureum]7Y4L_UA Chain UA, CaRSPs1 [Porphyridium purpureum]